MTEKKNKFTVMTILFQYMFPGSDKQTKRETDGHRVRHTEDGQRQQDAQKEILQRDTQMNLNSIN